MNETTPTRIIPPIKSQGIKTKLVPWILSLVPPCGGRWIEPFMGTGVVAFNAGFTRNLLSDANPHLPAFYNALKAGEITPGHVREHLEREGALLGKAAENGYAHYRFVRDRFNREHSPLDFLFLSRAGFNGMVRFNGRGEWNVPFCKKPGRFARAYVTKIVNQVARVSALIGAGWEFVAGDFREAVGSAGEGDILYCDPPYHGRHADYFSRWTDEDEGDLFEALTATKARFILSTWHHSARRENPAIARYRQRFNLVTREHFYHSGGRIENRNPVTEALVFNFEPREAPHCAGPGD